MRFSRIELRNWRNFRSIRVDLGERAFLIGPNAAGKSNFLDAFRFLREVATEGLEKAVQIRGGVSAVRCLSARQYSSVDIEVEIDDDTSTWTYRLVFNQDNVSRPVVKEERVTHNGAEVMSRLLADDKSDPELSRYTSLQQPVANQKFRILAEFFRTISYQHLLPQVVRDPKGFSPIPVADDPFGRDFLLRVWRTNPKSRDARLNKILQALRVAVPQLSGLRVEIDDSGAPHLVGAYEHWRPHAASQNEHEFSDGTLRLLGLLWVMFEGQGPLLLEEPEISLHPEVVRYIPAMFERIQRTRKTRRQVLISTHSEDLLSDKGIGAAEVIRLEPGKNGTLVRLATEDEVLAVEGGLSVADVILPKSAPRGADQLPLVF
jgi:predicted ATPase